MELEDALDILAWNRNHLDHQDFINIWGETLGNHIWRQEGSDLLKIWRSGLTKSQARDFLDYMIQKYKDEHVPVHNICTAVA